LDHAASLPYFLEKVSHVLLLPLADLMCIGTLARPLV
jgi:hypothetical protein